MVLIIPAIPYRPRHMIYRRLYKIVLAIPEMEEDVVVELSPELVQPGVWQPCTLVPEHLPW